ncbi:galactonate operon transcriptional repressor [Asticcacaulis biprosthecium C19]|uniref:Galactonate operon transcriptional repressor n=2 Tax=Asticcacaulis biprosthecium TaxID=76891 RepID=F4QM45_9CAUL|nr:galactonate operon transcriptional repressor [Asticcacaulis biprosthecium C19]
MQGVSLTYGLLETLGQSIVVGEFEASGFPTEAELCIRFGASRTVAREAVKMLTAKGLLSSRPRQGTRVEAVSNWNLLDPDVTRWMTERPYTNKIYRELTEVRLAIEPVAAALAAKRATKADLKAMRAAFNAMRDEASHHDLALLADIDFHVAILKASGNPFIIQLKELIHTALTISIGLTNRIAGHTASLPAHEAVLIAIENGQHDVAEKAMRAIIAESIDMIDTFKGD